MFIFPYPLPSVSILTHCEKFLFVKSSIAVRIDPGNQLTCHLWGNSWSVTLDLEDKPTFKTTSKLQSSFIYFDPCQCHEVRGLGVIIGFQANYKQGLHLQRKKRWDLAVKDAFNYSNCLLVVNLPTVVRIKPINSRLVFTRKLFLSRI